MTPKQIKLYVLCLLSTIVLFDGVNAFPKGVNGGAYCLACTTFVSLNQQFAEYHNTSFEEAFHKICSFFPPPLSNGCSVVGQFFLPVVLKYQTSSPDFICQAIHQCYTEKHHVQCRAYPNHGNEEQFRHEVKRARRFARERLHIDEKADTLSFDVCTLPVVKDICERIRKIFSTNKPFFDVDDDLFSSYEELRGYAWRGKDCNDLWSTYYPGRKPIKDDIIFDSNCNGIHGFNLFERRAWEDLLCANTTSQGTIALGDSVTAHFRVPPEWLTATELRHEIFRHFWFVLTNQFDWPMMSTFTGYYEKSDWPELISGPIDSVYKHVVERNLCNHRDYQNIGKNGADSFAMNDILLKALKRNTTTDKPVLLFYALVGNDVCSNDPLVAHMTTVEQMKDNALKTMETLDKILPSGSHVTLLGLADGRVLYDSMHARIHPIGKLRKDVTYAQLYDFLNCLEISPCAGWLNTNATVRNATTKHAEALSGVLQDIVRTHTYKNFDLAFIPNFFKESIKMWKEMGKGHETWQLIEPVDGFHPNQNAMALSAKVLVKALGKIAPHFLGEINPHNAKIRQLFGNQGGYK